MDQDGRFDATFLRKSSCAFSHGRGEATKRGLENEFIPIIHVSDEFIELDRH